MADVVAVEVDEGTEQLLHDHGSLFLSQMLPVDDKVEKFAALAIPTQVSRGGLITRALGNTRRSTPRFRVV